MFEPRSRMGPGFVISMAKSACPYAASRVTTHQVFTRSLVIRQARAESVNAGPHCYGVGGLRSEKTFGESNPSGHSGSSAGTTCR
jgi:hypothetical protein